MTQASEGVAIDAGTQVAEPTVGHSRWGKWITGERLIFLALILLNMIPVWAPKYFVSQDGPGHVQNAMILRDMVVFHDPATVHHYHLNSFPVPNLLGHVIMAATMLFVSALAAQKLFLSFYVILLPVSVRYAAGAINPRGKWAAYLIFPFIFCYPLHNGLFNFCLSLPLMFFMIGFWLKRRREFNWRDMLVLLTLAGLTYFSHLVSCAMGMLTIALLAAWFALADFRSETALGGKRRVIGRVALTALALLPSAIMVHLFLSDNRFSMPSEKFLKPASQLLNNLIRLDPLPVFRRSEYGLSTSFAAVFGVAIIVLLIRKIRSRGWDRWDGLLLMVAAAIAIYLRSPDETAGGGGLLVRLCLYPYFFVMLWLAAQPRIALLQRGVVIASAVVSFCFVTLRTVDQLRVQPYIAEMVSAGKYIKSGSTFIAVQEKHSDLESKTHPLAFRFTPWRHAAGYIAAQSHAIDLNNYEGKRDHFLVQYRRTQSAERALIGVHIYEMPDYVLFWNPQSEKTPDDAIPALFNATKWSTFLSKNTLIYTSPHGWAKLYRRNAIVAKKKSTTRPAATSQADHS